MKFRLFIIFFLSFILFGCTQPTSYKYFVIMLCSSYTDAENYDILESRLQKFEKKVYDVRYKEYDTDYDELSVVDLTVEETYYAHYYIVNDTDKSLEIDKIETDFSCIKILDIDSEKNVITFQATKKGLTRLIVDTKGFNTAYSLLMYIE